MYYMIEIHPSSWDFLRILGNPDESEVIKTHRLYTITYGTSSAPFLATQTLQHLAKDEGSKYPSAVSVLLPDVYMEEQQQHRLVFNREILFEKIGMFDYKIYWLIF